MATNANSVFIDSLKASLAPMGTVEIATNDPDVALLRSWNERQRILAEIEAHGRYYDGDNNCPAKMHAFEIFENAIPKMQALTAKGLLAKLWIALEHRGPHITTDELRAESDAVRRADFEEVEGFAERFDFDQSVIFEAIKNIRYWLQFEQVYLPTRAAQ